MKVIKTISLSLLVCSSLSFGWEINTHRAIDRCAIAKPIKCAILNGIGGEYNECDRLNTSQNLHWFAENLGLKNEDYKDETLEGYTTDSYLSPKAIGYFDYIIKGEEYGVSKWHQSFNDHKYTDLIEAGTILEDALWENVNRHIIFHSYDPAGGDGRFNFHFYDPQDKNHPGAGLSITPGFRNENAINWAENGGTGLLFNYVPKSGIVQITPAQIGQPEIHTNDYSYEKAKEYFKQGFTEQKPKDRKKYRAKMFVSLGYLLHLLNDMNVPAHTRDDAHPLGDPLEVWMRGGDEGYDSGGFRIVGSTVKGNNDILNRVKTISAFKYDSSVKFREFYKKQAEFTGENFYSEDSISVNGGTFGGYDDYSPKKSEVTVPTKDGYVTSNKSDILSNHNKIAVKVTGKVWKVKVLGKELKYKSADHYYIQKNGNNDVLVDNGVNLIPNAVANAEGFVNYFFRGRLQATLIDGNLTIKNISDPNLVASSIKFSDKTYKVYYETDNNETYPLKDCIASNALSKDDSFECDISQELEDKKNEIGKAQKLTVIYDGIIGNEKGVSVAIAKKFTNADLLFSFDKSGSMGSDIENAKNSAKDILDNVVGVDNNSTFIEIEAFSYGAGVILAYENNVTKAKNAINTIYSGGRTALYDAIKLAGDNAVTHKASSGISKSIVILYTDGQENSSSASRQQAIDAISNAKASSIDEVFLIFVGNNTDGKAKLKAIADEAGRKFMSVSNASGLKDAIEKILKGQ